VALISQSGALAGAMVLYAGQQVIGFTQ